MTSQHLSLAEIIFGNYAANLSLVVSSVIDCKILRKELKYHFHKTVKPLGDSRRFVCGIN